jgi:hypothetical protein
MLVGFGVFAMAIIAVRSSEIRMKSAEIDSSLSPSVESYVLHAQATVKDESE